VGNHQTDHRFDKEFTVIPKNTLSYPVNDSMTISLIHYVILETTIPPFQNLFPCPFWLVYLVSLDGIEEAGCQAREQFSGRENCWELISVGAKLQLQFSETSGLACC
jgi:hypothetical protein